MSFKYDEYLDKGTSTLLELISSADISNEEKVLLVDTFSAELEKNIVNSEVSGNPDQLIYSTVVRSVDDTISKYLADSGLSYAGCSSAIKLCNRQEVIIAKFAENGWPLPKLVNQNIEDSKNIFLTRQESGSISSKVMEEDKQISQLLLQAEKQFNVKDCDTLSSLLLEYEEDLKLCKQKKVSLPPLDNKDIKKVTKRVAEIRKIAEQKEALHNKMYELDLQLDSLASMVKTTPDQWATIINICQQQSALINDCTKKQWPLPSLRYARPIDLESKYKHYQLMQSNDTYLNNNRTTLTTGKQYKEYLDVCTKQKNNIDICNKNGWNLPELIIADPSEVYGIVSKEKNKRDGAAKIKRTLILIAVGAVAILALVIFCIFKYREGKVKIPFDNSYVVEKDIDDIYDELEDAGFDNIIKRQDNSGWLESGQVLSVTIDNRDIYNKDSYIKPDVSVIITYSSDDRLYITDTLTDWKNTDYETIASKLEAAGFTNVMIETVDTSDVEKDNLIATINLNGLNYTNEHCYLPANAPIIITYNVLKIGIGNNSTEFIGQNYEDVVSNLEDSGFTNVSTEQITTGWAEANTVIAVNINNSDSYDKDSTFEPDVKIVVKYSSPNRVDVTSVFSSWGTKQYTTVKSGLSNLGFTNVTYKEVTTSDISQNQLVASITINGEKYSQGDCYVQKSAPIIIEYYNLKITIGQKPSAFTSNKENEYQNVVATLEAMGFTNIQLQRNNDLINGWITKEGSVESITINGNASFTESDTFDYYVPIVIVVNTFKGKGCEDITTIAP